MAENKVEDHAQLLSTVEMFEVITQTNPDDYQSLEILKEAYIKLGRETEAITVSKKIAEAYVSMGQISSAILEYEGILQKQPDSVDVLMALGDLEQKLSEMTKKPSAPVMGGSGDPGAVQEEEQIVASLIETSHTKTAKKGKITLEGDPNEPFVKYLQKLGQIPSDKLVEAGQTCVSRLPKSSNELGVSLVQVLSEMQAVKTEDLLNTLLERTRLGYAPLEFYETDRNIVKMLPAEIAVTRLIIPFDQVSRTLMVALVNPFDEVGRQAVQQTLEYNIHWYLASPEAMIKIIKQTFKV